MRLTVLRGMSRFQCIGSACEDTCCGGLRVSITPEWLAKIGEVIGSERAEACAEHSEEDGLSMRMRRDGACPFLSTERLCSLQRDHGAAALPEICARFPRVPARLGDRVELTGSLGCPEVVRQLLVAEDGLELDHSEAEFVPEDRSTPVTRLVREAFLGIASRTDLPLSSRLACLAQLAAAVDSLDSRDALVALLDQFRSSEVLTSIHANHQQLAAVLPREPTLGT